MNKNKKKILIIEDEPDMRQILKSMLETYYEVLTAKDGEEGLKLAIKKKPDLVLLDIILPKMGGFEVLSKMQYDPATREIPVIILSNLGQEKEVEKGKALGACDYLVKARVHLADILKKVEAVLKSR